jgi:hypothetical protein
VVTQWIHEIKHDGYRLIARKRADRVRSRAWWSNQRLRFGLITDGVGADHCAVLEHDRYLSLI